MSSLSSKKPSSAAAAKPAPAAATAPKKKMFKDFENADTSSSSSDSDSDDEKTAAAKLKAKKKAAAAAAAAAAETAAAIAANAKASKGKKTDSSAAATSSSSSSKKKKKAMLDSDSGSSSSSSSSSSSDSDEEDAAKAKQSKAAKTKSSAGSNVIERTVIDQELLNNPNKRAMRFGDSDSDSDDAAAASSLNKLTVNKEYGEKFEREKAKSAFSKETQRTLQQLQQQVRSQQREEARLQRKIRFAQRYEERAAAGEDLALEDESLPEGSSDEEDYSSEDETGKLMDADVETGIFKALHAIRNKDKSIYDKNATFFKAPVSDDDDEDSDATAAKKAAERKREKNKVTLGSFLAAQAQTGGDGMFADDSTGDEAADHEERLDDGERDIARKDAQRLAKAQGKAARAKALAGGDASESKEGGSGELKAVQGGAESYMEEQARLKREFFAQLKAEEAAKLRADATKAALGATLCGEAGDSSSDEELFGKARVVFDPLAEAARKRGALDGPGDSDGELSDAIIGSDSDDDDGADGGEGKTAMSLALAKARKQDRARRTAIKEASDEAAMSQMQFLESYLTQGWWKEGAAVPDADKVLGKARGNALINGEHELEEDDDAAESDNDRFEAERNFRFEEPGANELALYPRAHLITDSLRIGKESRKKARQRKADRLREDRERKMEEIKRLKNVTKRAMVDRLKAISVVAGLADQLDDAALASDAESDAEADKKSSGKLMSQQEKEDRMRAKMAKRSGLLSLDLTGDWDPAEYDRQMATLFGESYYGADDAAMGGTKKDKKSSDGDDEDDYDSDDEVDVEEQKRATGLEVQRLLGEIDAKTEARLKREAADAEARVAAAGGFGDDSDEEEGEEEDEAASIRKAKKKQAETAQLVATQVQKQTMATKKFLHRQVESLFDADGDQEAIAWWSKEKERLLSGSGEYAQLKGLRGYEKEQKMKEILKVQMEKLYDLDKSDVLTGSRFQYEAVPARDYGMSVEEILNADDGELNTKLSIKKLAPYREDNDDKRSWREIKKAGSIKRKLANGDEVWEDSPALSSSKVHSSRYTGGAGYTRPAPGPDGPAYRPNNTSGSSGGSYGGNSSSGGPAWKRPAGEFQSAASRGGARTFTLDPPAPRAGAGAGTGAGASASASAGAGGESKSRKTGFIASGPAQNTKVKF